MEGERAAGWETRLTENAFVLAAVVTDLDRVAGADSADAVEFRMDMATTPVEQLSAYDGMLPIIATNRREAEGGNAADDGRLDVLVAAAEHPAVTAVDIELATIEAHEGEAVLDACAKTDTDLIVSWHDFEGTPAESDLERRLRAAAAHGTIAKAAVTAESIEDVLTLLTVTHRLSADDIPVATMSMGEAGRHSRIIAPLYGSRIGYAPVDPDDATAPGQFDLATMADLIELVR